MDTRKKTAMLIGALLLLAFIAALPAYAEINVFINAKQVFFDVPPERINNRTMVPLRGIFEGLGAEVKYNAATRTIVSTRGTTEVRLTLGDRNAYVNGEMRLLDVPAASIGGRTMVPLRFVGEAFGAEVKWYAATQTIEINDASAQVTKTDVQPNEFTGMVTQVSPAKRPPTIQVQQGNMELTFEVAPDTAVFQKQVGGKTSGSTTLSQIFPGDEVTITTNKKDDYVARKIESRYRVVKGTITRVSSGRISVKGAGQVTIAPGASVFLNKRPASVRDIAAGQQATLRVNPTTNGTMWIALVKKQKTQPTQKPNLPVAGPGIINDFYYNDSAYYAPGDIITFAMRGTPGSTAYFTIPGIVNRYPMMEVSPGYYEGRYTFTEGDNPESVRPFGILERQGYPMVNYTASRQVQFNDDRWRNVTRPAVIRDFSFSGSDSVRPGDRITFTLTGTPGAAVRFTIPGIVERVNMRETSRGNYSAVYTMPNVNKNFKVKPYASLEYEKNPTITKFASRYLLVRADVQQLQARIDSFKFTPTGLVYPGQKVTFTLRGTPGGAAYVKLQGLTDNVRMQERSSGHYVTTVAMPAVSNQISVVTTASLQKSNSKVSRTGTTALIVQPKDPKTSPTLLPVTPTPTPTKPKTKPFVPVKPTPKPTPQPSVTPPPAYSTPKTSK